MYTGYTSLLFNLFSHKTTVAKNKVYCTKPSVLCYPSTPFASSGNNNYFRLLNRKCFRCERVSRSSVRVNSYFTGSRTFFRKTTTLSLEMGTNDSLKVMGIEGTASRKVWNKFTRKCSEVAWGALLRNPITQLGGPGVIIQIDESKFNHKSKVSI